MAKKPHARIAKVIEVIGSSPDGFSEAAQVAVTEASKTVRNITGVEVVSMTGTVSQNPGRITEYKTTVKIAFGVE